MRIQELKISGVYEVQPEVQTDERGSFGRTWDSTIAKEHGLEERFEYTCISTNTALHTLRGMHWQEEPFPEVKLVRCTKGSMFDVVIDLRKESPTYKQWIGVELSDENHTALYIPKGCAHGFLTLKPDTEVLYAISGKYDASAAKGVRFNDPMINIEWPAEPKVISGRDAGYPLLS